jgi:ATP-binding cassette subfamily C (CFTR/MRP) protein 1
MSILEPIALASLPILAYVNHTRARCASTVLLLFWPFYVAAQMIWTRTAVASGLPFPSASFALRWATVSLGAVAFVLERLGPEYGESSSGDSDKLYPENPLLTADIFNVWYFSWLDTLMRLGSKRPVTEADLPDLLVRDESTLLGDKLSNAMTHQ